MLRILLARLQDHRGASASNTHIVLENVESTNCRHIIRTANSVSGHANLILHNLTGRNCDSPIQISNTKNVPIEGLRLECKAGPAYPPINFKNCEGVRLSKVILHGLKAVIAVHEDRCQDVRIERTLLRTQPNAVDLR